MKMREHVAGLAVLSALVVGMTWFGRGTTSAQQPAPAAPKHFLEIGKSYHVVAPSIGDWTIKVLEEPRPNWIKAEVRDKERGKVIGLLNLDHVTWIALEEGR